ncbi:hypothetical protein SeMB42_g07179 [Synchytrium endobioticum]|uniref:Uncharacterized protein n=1 Tax=Synchytrium endobioticum TaxID=286115 RepID=A0A507CND7_9FUNG|nr:hypothetical protein SeMB42_g07179 [Synchytrium endobioticum]TPX40640.1 hypothetical protein SeLEV6574_g06514 [Synchytrium endobioticum]
MITIPLDIPGYYFDAEKQKYFKLSKTAVSGRTDPYSVASIKKRSEQQIKTSLQTKIKSDESCAASRIGRSAFRKATAAFPTLCLTFEHNVELKSNMKRQLAWECMSKYLKQRYTTKLNHIGTISDFDVNTERRLICIASTLRGKLRLMEMNLNHELLQKHMNTTFVNSTSEISSVQFTTFKSIDAIIATQLGYGCRPGCAEIYQYLDSQKELLMHPKMMYKFQPARTAFIWTSAVCKPSGKFALGTSDGVYIHSTTNAGPDTTSLFDTSSDVVSVSFDSDVDSSVYCGLRDGSILLFDMRRKPGVDLRRPASSSTPSSVSAYSTIRHSVAVSCLKPLYGGTRLLSSTVDGKLFLWDTRKANSPLLDFGDVTCCVQSSFVSDATDSVVFSAGNDGCIRSWSLRTGALLMQKELLRNDSYRPTRSKLRLVDDSELWVSLDDTLQIWNI